MITQKTAELRAGCGKCRALTRGPARRELRTAGGRRAAGLGRRRGGAWTAGGAEPPRRGGASGRVSEGLPWLGCAHHRLHVPPEGQEEHVTSGSPGAGETKAERARRQGRHELVFAWKMELPTSLKKTRALSHVYMTIGLYSSFKGVSLSVL